MKFCGLILEKLTFCIMGRLNGYSMMLQFSNSHKRASTSMFILLICIPLFICFPLGLSEIRGYECKNDTGYKDGSRYASNLKRVLDDLVKNAASSGFNTTSHGEIAKEKVYGLLQCTGDASPQDCSKFSQEARITLPQLCGNAIGGQLWLDTCFLRYDNVSFFSDLDTHVISILRNPQTVKANPGGFQNEVADLLRNLKDKACDPASKGFAARSVTTSSSDWHRVFGLAECWRDLSVEQCGSCFSIALINLYHYTEKEGGEALLGSCRMRYEIHPFPPLFPSNASASQISPRKPSRNLAIICGGVGGGLIALAVCLFIIRNKMISVILLRSVPLRQTEDSERHDGVSGSLFNSQMVFRLDTLIEATGKFQEVNKLGEGGFGSVYKGVTSDGTEIAVKKLSLSSGQGTREFMNEVKLVAKIQHRNLVQLLGCCVEGPERLLVYEYLPNKSLDTFLFNPEKRKVLDWQKRHNIIIGIARGLLYLHEDSQLRIIHRDVKANNILLDDKLNPKIADFGLARLFPRDETHVHTRVAGTYGYMAPEYAMLGQLSVKADVYSFGVVLLEIVTGRKNNDIKFTQEMQSLLEWGWRLYKRGNLLNMIDPTIVKCCPQEEALRCIHVGLLCVQADAATRPAMSEVVLMLSTSSMALPNPTKPAFVSLSLSGDLSPKDEAVTMSRAPLDTQLPCSTLSVCCSSSIISLEPR